MFFAVSIYRHKKLSELILVPLIKIKNAWFNEVVNIQREYYICNLLWSSAYRRGVKFFREAAEREALAKCST